MFESILCNKIECVQIKKILYVTCGIPFVLCYLINMIWQNCIFPLSVVTIATFLPLLGLHFDK